jgi:hypothetical protein
LFSDKDPRDETTVPLLVFLLQPAGLLVGTDHGHLKIAGRQDVKHAVILALAPVLASLFRGKLVDRRFRETTTELASSLGGSRHGAHLRMLRKTQGMEELGLRVENLPVLAKSIGIVNDSLSVTANHVTRFESAHEANTLAKMLGLGLLKQDRDKILVGLDLDAFAIAQMNFKDMLLVGGLRMQELKSAKFAGQICAC